MTDILSGLNPQQRQAVLATDGPVLIFAGAGSGKTRVLTRKIAWLLKAKKTTGSRILAVTFTNKAANEMKERVSELLGQVNFVNIGTFHSIGVRILRSEKDIPGHRSDFTIYDTDDTKKIIRDILKAQGIDTKELPPAQLRHYISHCKQDLKTAAEAEKAAKGKYMQERMAFLYGEYEREMQRNNACDFDDLLMRPLQIFRDYPGVAEKYRHRWDYILVDEYQDTNAAQFRMVRLFSEKTRNICVVGDDDQSIYGWRGADIRNILEFEKSFPNATVIKLEQNYRSTRTIIEAASGMIRGNDDRADKKLWTERKQGEKILHKEVQRDYEEADYIATEILHSGCPLRDFAVLYRTNAQSRLLEDALRNRGMRYELVGGVKFYERKEIKDILAYLNVLVNPRDAVNLKRIVNFPARRIGETSIKKLETFAAQTRRSLREAFQYPAEAGLHTRAQRQLEAFMEMMEFLRTAMGELSPAELAVEVLEKSGLHALYREKKDPELQERLRNQEEFVNGVKMFERYNPDAGIEDFLQDVSLQTDIDRWEDSQDAVTLMTIHSAKGLEFPRVFIAGMEEGLFPLERARMNKKEMEEERRLFYVALTRAMERVVLTSCCRRMKYGQVQDAGPSEFIREIPAEHLREERVKRIRRPPEHAASAEHIREVLRPLAEAPIHAEDRDLKPLRPPSPGSVKAGDRVRHKMFGKGKVKSVIRSSQTLLRIEFNNGVKKTIAEKFVEKI